MKSVRVYFAGFWDGFDPENNIFVRLLRTKYEVIIDKDNPEYIFCSMFGNPYEYLKYDGIRIFYSGENYSPDFNFVDYGIAYNRDFKYEDRFCRNRAIISGDLKAIEDYITSKRIITAEDISKKKFCNFIYSHDRDDYKRREVFQKLNNYKRVDSAGTYLNNMENGKLVSMDEKIDFINNYKFTIAFESVDLSGFATEKMLHAFFGKSVPIYLGDPKISEIYNKKAFVNANDFESIDALVEHIKWLDENEEEYLKIVNEPTFNPEFDYKKICCDFDDFILHIFEQDYASAFRRGSGPIVDGAGVLAINEANLRALNTLSNSRLGNILLRFLQKKEFVRIESCRF